MINATAKVTSIHARVTACPATFECMPEEDEVFAWMVDLSSPPIRPDDLFRRLTPEEQARATRYKIPKAREQFVIGRGLLRGLLGDYLGVAPTAVPLAYLSSGKPILGDRHADLHFNVTHTDGIAVLVVGRQRVGVDVERVRPMLDAEGLVGRYFSLAESAAFCSLPTHQRPAAFFRGWTCKEAVIKGAGATVGCLADFDVELHPERPPCVNSIREPLLGGVGWALAEWRTADNALIAIAVEGRAVLTLEIGDIGM